MTGWNVHRLSAGAGELHALDLLADPEPGVWLLDVDRPSLVLGSSQPEHDVDAGVAEREGVEVVRRHSGGGAVLLLPGEAVWIDVVLPRGHVSWDDDVSRSMLWLGRAWVDALGSLGCSGATVHEGAMVCGAACKAVCFAGLGPGEVVHQGAKAVGISQRRTRTGARFQSLVLRNWTPHLYQSLLAPALTRLGTSPATLSGLQVSVFDAASDSLLEALHAALELNE